MASYIYNSYLANLGGEGVHVDWVADAIKVALLMSLTTADTENTGIDFVGNFTTLDEFDGTGYTAGFGNRITLGTKTVSDPDPNNRADLDAADVAGLSLGNGTRPIAGILIYKELTSDLLSPVIAWIDDGGFPVDGSNLSGITWAAGGIIQISHVGGP